ncbi:hypothetical protein Leryth_002467 [Lithospermum erythrorhizon]|nr:hypothetical protein Leryth_002467 [Lithospermum erythrorhizon]
MELHIEVAAALAEANMGKQLSHPVSILGAGAPPPAAVLHSTESLGFKLGRVQQWFTLQSQRDTYGEDRRDEKGGFLEKNKSLKRRYVEQEAFDG